MRFFLHMCIFFVISARPFPSFAYKLRAGSLRRYVRIVLDVCKICCNFGLRLASQFPRIYVRSDVQTTIFCPKTTNYTSIFAFFRTKSCIFDYFVVNLQPETVPIDNKQLKTPYNNEKVFCSSFNRHS